MDGVLQDVFATIGQQHLLLRHAVDLAQLHGDHTLLTLVVDTGVETERLGVEILDGIHHLLAGLEIELVSIEKIHLLFHILLFYAAKVLIN